jgi:hypothetical protein
MLTAIFSSASVNFIRSPIEGKEAGDSRVKLKTDKIRERSVMTKQKAAEEMNMSGYVVKTLSQVLLWNFAKLERVYCAHPTPP